MAASILPRPGTPLGPCAAPCNHLDCTATREDAVSVCRLCASEIGYGRRYYREGLAGGLVHADCAEIEAEREDS
jgi:hypothetical protein